MDTIIKKIIALTLLFLVTSHMPAVAADLTNLSINLSTIKPITSANHTIHFRTATTSNLKQIDFHYRKTNDSSQKPAHLDISSAQLVINTGLNASWTLQTDNSTGLLSLNNTAGEDRNANTDIDVTFNSITNPEIGDCTQTGKMYDECFVFVKTYSDAGLTAVDTALYSYTIEDEPSLSFTISGVNSNVVTNGITTNIATAYNEIPFGNLQIRTPIYAAQKLRVTTTAANGYVVRMRVLGYLQGLMSPTNKIDPFFPLNCAWSAPKLWQTPASIVANSDTGWFGANTNDTRIASYPDNTLIEWLSAAGKFGPVSSTRQIIMYSPGKDYGTDAYISFGIEVNEYQPPDSYAVQLEYDIIATY
jgi:hypothetical protein